MAAPQIDQLPPAPGPSDPGDVFDAKAFELTQAWPGFINQTNAVAAFVEQDAALLNQAVTDAQSAQGLAEDARDASQQAETGAQQAETGAQAAESGVRAVVGSYPNTAAGLSATTDGQYFALDGSGHIYLSSAGVAEQITDYDSLAAGIGMISAALDEINGEVV